MPERVTVIRAAPRLSQLVLILFVWTVWREETEPRLVCSRHQRQEDVPCGAPVEASPDMFLSCCCAGKKESKKRKKSSSGSSQSACPSSPQYQPKAGPDLLFTPHSPIFTIQSQNNTQSASLSEEDFYYYQVGTLALSCHPQKNINHSPCQDIYLQSRETLVRPKSKHNQTVGFNPGASNLSFIDTSPLDNQTILDKPATAKTLPRSSRTSGPLPCKIFASPENFKLSVRSLSQSSRSMVSSSPEFMR